eukprot:2080094-Prymnesium_polylepis.1
MDADCISRAKSLSPRKNCLAIPLGASGVASSIKCLACDLPAYLIGSTLRRLISFAFENYLISSVEPKIFIALS